MLWIHLLICGLDTIYAAFACSHKESISDSVIAYILQPVQMTVNIERQPQRQIHIEMWLIGRWKDTQSFIGLDPGYCNSAAIIKQVMPPEINVLFILI